MYFRYRHGNSCQFSLLLSKLSLSALCRIETTAALTGNSASLEMHKLNWNTYRNSRESLCIGWIRFRLCNRFILKSIPFQRTRDTRKVNRIFTKAGSPCSTDNLSWLLRTSSSNFLTLKPPTFLRFPCVKSNLILKTPISI